MTQTSNTTGNFFGNQSTATFFSVTISTKGCLPKKKSIWRDIVPTSCYPLPPFKSRDKNRRDILKVLEPPPPLQRQGYMFNFCTYQEMIFKETNFDHLLFTPLKYI